MHRLIILTICFAFAASTSLAALVDPSPTTLRELRAELREEADLKAQQSMADIASGALIVAAIGTFLSALAAGVSLYALRRTVEIGQQQSRAYVNASKVEVASDGKAIIVHVRNDGLTPAGTFSIGLELKKLRFGSVTENISLRDYTMKTWSGLPKDDQKSCRMEPTYGKELLNEFAKSEFEPEECLVVIGRIVYVDVFDEVFESGFAFFTYPKIAGRFQRPLSSLSAYRRSSKSYRRNFFNGLGRN